MPPVSIGVGVGYDDGVAVSLKEYGCDGDIKRGDKSPLKTRQGPSPPSKTLTNDGNVREPSATLLVCLDERNEDITPAAGAVSA